MAIVRDPQTGRLVRSEDLSNQPSSPVTLPSTNRTTPQGGGGIVRDPATGRLIRATAPNNVLPPAPTSPYVDNNAMGSVLGGVADLGKEVLLAPVRALAAPFAAGSEALISQVTGLPPRSNALSRFAFRGTEPSRFARLDNDPNNPMDRNNPLTQAYASPERAFAQAENVLDVGSLMVGGGIASQGIKGGAKGFAKEALKQLPTEALIGGAYGLTSSGRAGLPASDMLANTATGTFLGGTIGFATPLLGYALTRRAASRQATRRAAQNLEQQAAENFLQKTFRQADENAASRLARTQTAIDFNPSRASRLGSIATQEVAQQAAPDIGQAITRGVEERAFSSRAPVQQVARELRQLPVTPVNLPRQLIEDISVGQPVVVREVAEAISTGSPSVLDRFARQQIDDVLEAVRKVSPDQAARAEDIISQNIVAQNVARRQLEREFGQVPRSAQLAAETKRKFVDFLAPVEDTLRRAENEGGFTIRPQNDIRPQFDRIFRATTAAELFLDQELRPVIQEAERRGVFNQLGEYLIAKQAQDIRAVNPNVQLGRSAAQDALLIRQFQSQLEPLARRVNTFAQRVLDRAVEGGLVSSQAAQRLKQIYPNYVPVDRVFAAIEEVGPITTGNLASVTNQKVVQSLRGSQRAIENPIESLFNRTKTAFLQVEKNKAAQMMAAYRALPNNPFGISPAKSGLKAPAGKVKFSAFVDGKKQTYLIDQEFGKVLAAANPNQIDLIGRILAMPVRIAKAGITGLNIPFLLTNFFRDQIVGFVNSPKAWNTALNPLVFLKAFTSALKHDELYMEAVRAGAITTSLDYLRNPAITTVAKIRATSSPRSLVKFAITNPKDFISIVGRGVENLVSRSEELRRLQEFSGVRDALLREGASKETADILGAESARWVTANFLRRGEYGQALNSVFMYLNAGIQGNRATLRAFRAAPAKTTAKVVGGVFIPLASVLAWNLNSPDRKAAYESIPEWEKDSNFILIPPNPTQDADGRWNVYKIPLPPNIGSLTIPIRKAFETMNGLDPVRFRDLAKSLIGVTSPIQPEFENPRRFATSIASAVTPQAIKPTIEALTNRNLFTDTPIVPQSLVDLPSELQVKDNTSGTARLIGGAANVSPIQVEQFVKGTFGGLGSQTLNALDTVAAKLGLIPESQIGGESIAENIRRRFLLATGGETDRKAFERVQELRTQGKAASYLRKREAMEIVTQLETAPPAQRAAILRQARRDPDLFKRVQAEQKERKLGLTDQERLIKSLGVNDGSRAQFIYELTKDLPVAEVKKIEKDLLRKKVLTTEVHRQLLRLRRGGVILPQPDDAGFID